MREKLNSGSPCASGPLVRPDGTPATAADVAATQRELFKAYDKVAEAVAILEKVSGSGKLVAPLNSVGDLIDAVTVSLTARTAQQGT